MAQTFPSLQTTSAVKLSCFLCRGRYVTPSFPAHSPLTPAHNHLTHMLTNKPSDLTSSMYARHCWGCISVVIRSTSETKWDQRLTRVTACCQKAHLTCSSDDAELNTARVCVWRSNVFLYYFWFSVLLALLTWCSEKKVSLCEPVEKLNTCESKTLIWLI